MTGGGGGAVLRFSRDKRGYEHFYLVHLSNNRRGRSRSRLLYWFRTPPDVKIGRSPFDAEMRRTLEARYPEVAFDWKKLSETPVPPPPEAEKWRERRKAERAAKRFAAAEAAEELAASEPDAAPAIEAAPAAESPEVEPPRSPILPPAPATDATGARRRRRRRRGRRRPGEAPQAAGAVLPAAASGPDAPPDNLESDSDSEGEE